MFRLVRADLRESWTAWLGVALTFVATSAALACTLLLRGSVVADRDAGGIGQRAYNAYASSITANLLLGAITSVVVVAAATGLVVTARRSALARYALAGARPRTLVGVVVCETAVVSLACSVVGDLVAIGLQPAASAFVGDTYQLAAAATRVDPAALVIADVLAMVLAMLGSLWQAGVASRVSPIAALREATAIGATRRWLRVAVVAVALLLVVGIMLLGAQRIPGSGDTYSTTLKFGLAVLPVTGLAIAIAAPAVIGHLTRAWTAIVPARGGAWLLARSTVVVKAPRLTRTVVPIMLAVGLPVGMKGVADTFSASLTASDPTHPIPSASLHSLALLVGLSALVTIASAVGGLVMMSRQRSAELALDGIIGATPRQQVAVPVLEGVILALSASLLGLLMAFAGPLFLLLVLPGQLSHVVLALPWTMALGIVAVAVVVSVAATTLPSLPALRRPAPEVIAQLVAA